MSCHADINGVLKGITFDIHPQPGRMLRLWGRSAASRRRYHEASRGGKRHSGLKSWTSTVSLSQTRGGIEKGRSPHATISDAHGQAHLCHRCKYRPYFIFSLCVDKLWNVRILLGLACNLCGCGMNLTLNRAGKLRESFELEGAGRGGRRGGQGMPRRGGRGGGHGSDQCPEQQS